MASALPLSIGKYRIIRRMGRGGMGTVYLAHDDDLNRAVAIKVLSDSTLDPSQVERFLQEARAAAKLRHDNLVTIYETGQQADGQLYIAMEFVDGPTLFELIASRAPLDLAQKLVFLEQICAGLEEVHRADIVHRDIKPANLLIDSRGVLRIVDFGVARVDDSALTRDGSSIGTIGYMAPQQLRGEPATVKSDIFSMGIVAYELLTYERAFPTVHRPPLRRLNDAVPEAPAALQAWIDRATADEESGRFADIAEAREALLRIPRTADATLVHPGVGPADTETVWPPLRTETFPRTMPRYEPVGAEKRDLVVPWWRQGRAIVAAAMGVLLVSGALVIWAVIEPTASDNVELPAGNDSTADSIILAPKTGSSVAMPKGPPDEPAGPTRTTTLPPPPVQETMTPGRSRAADRATPAAPAATPANASPPEEQRSPAEIFRSANVHDLRSPTGQAPSRPSDDGLIQVAPGLRYEVLKRTPAGAEQSVDSASTFYSGDAIRLAFESNINGFLYVMHRESTGDWTVLFPHPEINGGINRVNAFQRFVIPTDRWFEFDNTPGREPIVVFLSRTALTAVPRLNAPVRDDQVVAQVAVNALDAGIGVRSIRLQKVAEPRPGATAAPGTYAVNVAESASAVTVRFELVHK